MFEQLEGRLLLAGHVRASLSDGDLVIRGDNASNGIEIRRVDSNTVKVQGISTAGSATSINGRANGSVQFDIRDDVLCYLDGGSDRLTIKGTAQTQPVMVRDRLLVYGEAGNDVIQINYVSVIGDCKFSLGEGNDHLTTRYLYVGDDLTVTSVSESITNNKNLDIRGINYVAGDTNIRTGNGDDLVRISRLQTDLLNIYLRDGNDRLVVDVTHADDGVFHGGAGIDTLELGPNDFPQFPQLLGFNVFV